ncbi:hypothetical protein D3C73_1362470 [compost metagenome]
MVGYDNIDGAVFQSFDYCSHILGSPQGRVHLPVGIHPRNVFVGEDEMMGANLCGHMDANGLSLPD